MVSVPVVPKMAVPAMPSTVVIVPWFVGCCCCHRGNQLQRRPCHPQPRRCSAATAMLPRPASPVLWARMPWHDPAPRALIRPSRETVTSAPLPEPPALWATMPCDAAPDVTMSPVWVVVTALAEPVPPTLPAKPMPLPRFARCPAAPTDALGEDAVRAVAMGHDVANVADGDRVAVAAVPTALAECGTDPEVEVDVAKVRGGWRS